MAFSQWLLMKPKEPQFIPPLDEPEILVTILRLKTWSGEVAHILVVHQEKWLLVWEIQRAVEVSCQGPRSSARNLQATGTKSPVGLKFWVLLNLLLPQPLVVLQTLIRSRGGSITSTEVKTPLLNKPLQLIKACNQFRTGPAWGKVKPSRLGSTRRHKVVKPLNNRLLLLVHRPPQLSI